MRSVRLGESTLIARHIVALNTTAMPPRLCGLSAVERYRSSAAGSHASNAYATAVAYRIGCCCVRNEMMGTGAVPLPLTLRRYA